MPGGKQEVKTEQRGGEVSSLKAQAQAQGQTHAHFASECDICYDNPRYKGSEKLKDKVALIAGAAKGIGRSIAIFYAREGADVCVLYLGDDKEAEITKQLVEKEGRKCLLIHGDLCDINFCRKSVEQCLQHFKKLDILVNHAGTAPEPVDKPENISAEQFDKIMHNNVYSMFYMTQAALPHLREGGSIINTSSITAFRGDKMMLDYAASKGATRALTYSMAQNLAERKIRVNEVAPGLICTPMVRHALKEEVFQKLSSKTLMQRPGQPCEVAPAYVFLASNDASYVTGQTIHVNGGVIVD